MSYDIYVRYKDGHIENYPLCASSQTVIWSELAGRLSLKFLHIIDGVSYIYTLEEAQLFIEELGKIAEYIDQHPQPGYLSIRNRIPYLIPFLNHTVARWDEVEEMSY